MIANLISMTSYKQNICTDSFCDTIEILSNCVHLRHVLSKQYGICSIFHTLQYCLVSLQGQIVVCQDDHHHQIEEHADRGHCSCADQLALSHCERHNGIFEELNHIWIRFPM